LLVGSTQHSVSLCFNFGSYFLACAVELCLLETAFVSVFKPFYVTGTLQSIQIAFKTSCSVTWVHSVPNGPKHHFPIRSYVRETLTNTGVCALTQ